MSTTTFALPAASKVVVVIGFVALVAASLPIVTHENMQLWLLLLAFTMSAYLSDLITGIAHFCFDYVFPYGVPILGPISKEFTEHHDEPSLDPSDYVANLTKGAYASIPLSLAVIGLHQLTEPTNFSFVIETVIFGMSFLALFFHQIHSYAHMGKHVAPEAFKARVEEIKKLPTKQQQIDEFRKVFDVAPIPRPIRLLQRCGLLLRPEKHNVHHIHFESDFSSVNGWSDPLLNLVAGPLARYYKTIPNRQR